MKKIINIHFDKVMLKANLYNTKTAKKIISCLPVESCVNVWGEEIYFDIPISIEKETDAKTDVDVGDLAFWPVGNAFCIFFGPTPVSTDENPKAYSPVNVFGKLFSNIELLRKVQNNSKVKINLGN